MKTFHVRFRTLAVFSLLPLAAACGGDGTGAAGLSPEQVAGDYRVCSLAFSPEGSAPPAVDIRAALDTAATRLEILQSRQFGLVYKQPTLPTRTVTGAYVTGQTDMRLDLPATQEARALLLPDRLFLDVNTQTRNLTVSEAQASYTVRKADYEALTGRSEPNITNDIRGRLTGRFVPQNASCG